VLPDIGLEDTDKRILLEAARESIASKLEGRKPVYNEPTAALSGEFGAFVTLRIRGRLRGCIGILDGAQEIFQSIKNIARSSAFNDPRFPPVTNAEFAEVRIEISVLTPMVKEDAPNAVEVGKHGLYVKQGTLSGILLPQVAAEQGWDREEFLSATCKKAGLDGDAWRDDHVDLYTFSAVVFSEET
jgi:uncharacterized protein